MHNLSLPRQLERLRGKRSISPTTQRLPIKRSLLTFFLACIVGQHAALAELTVFDSRAEFEAAVPAALTIEDFSTVDPNASLNDNPVSLFASVNSGITVSASGGSLQTVGQFLLGEVGIDSPDFQGNFLTGRAEADTQDAVILTFPRILNRHHAVGFDYSGATGGLGNPDGAEFNYRVTTVDGTSIASVFPGDDGFIGFFDPICPIASIEFFDAEPNGINFGEGWGLDNLAVSLEALPDTDGDGMPDVYEETIPGLDSGVADGDGDLDGDTLTNVQEFERCTDPNLADTDGDGLADNIESNSGVFASPSDTGTDPNLTDTDGDGFEDGVETNTGLFVDANDTGTDPNNPDTDGDGIEDGIDPDPFAPPAGSLVHLYEFESDLGDTLGGPDIVANGGTLGNGEYSFGPNQGLTLTTAQYLASSYSIGLRFVVANSTLGWKKFIDFKNRLDDTGMYSFDNTVGFVGLAGSDQSVLFPDIVIDLVLTRDAATNLLRCHINGSPSPLFSVEDAGSLSVAHNPGNAALFHFFMDDAATGFTEAFSGTVDEIRIWDGPLSEEAIPDAFAPIETTIEISEVLISAPEGGPVSAALTWNSRPNRPYIVEFSGDLRTWTEIEDGVSSKGSQTTVLLETQAIGDGSKGYYRVIQN